MSDPWMKFYTADWRADPRLRMCSMAARGLWIEMICLMHEATPYGHLLVSGQCPTDAQLAVLVGAAPDQIAAMLGELETAGVFSRTKEGVIYSRKLSRMAKKAAVARNNGRKGGNPTLSNKRVNIASDKGDVNGRLKPQIPDTRYQIDSDANASGGDAADFAKIVFDRGVAFLCKHGHREQHARSLIGKWRKDHGDREIFDAFAAASKEGVTDPAAWIAARLKVAAPFSINFDLSKFEAKQ